jgi:hypothetical protein
LVPHWYWGVHSTFPLFCGFSLMLLSATHAQGRTMKTQTLWALSLNSFSYHYSLLNSLLLFPPQWASFCCYVSHWSWFPVDRYTLTRKPVGDKSSHLQWKDSGCYHCRSGISFPALLCLFRLTKFIPHSVAHAQVCSITQISLLPRHEWLPKLPFPSLTSIWP